MSRLADSVLAFARLLRRAGLPVGPGHTLDAVRAAGVVDVFQRDELYWALHAVFVSAPTQRELFDRAFRAFWRDPSVTDAAMSLLLPALNVPPSELREPATRRLREALGSTPRNDAARSQGASTPVDMRATYSDVEALRQRDFEQMSADEIQRARALIAGLRLPVPTVPDRRLRPDVHGDRIDLRRTLRATAAADGRGIRLRFRARRQRASDLVVLCDISGSMESYSRMFLHFMHAVTDARDRVHSFVFGTRLTPITRALRDRDVDAALARLGLEVRDWAGGTRIGTSLREFNRRWARRVLGRGAVVLLMTDGLDRGTSGELSREAARLRRSCRRLVWLNPLLRYAEFEPLAAGIRELLPNVDDFRPVHNLASLEDLVAALGERPGNVPQNARISAREARSAPPECPHPR